LGFGVWGLGFGVWGLGFGVWGLGFGFWGLGFGVHRVRFSSYCSGCNGGFKIMVCEYRLMMMRSCCC
jgi:hypothetical protein